MRLIFFRTLGQRVDNDPVVDQEAEERLGLCESLALVSDFELQRHLLHSICSLALSPVKECVALTHQQRSSLAHWRLTSRAAFVDICRNQDVFNDPFLLGVKSFGQRLFFKVAVYLE